MRKLVFTSLLAVVALWGQTAETHFFVADMRGANEVPAVATGSYGSAVLFVHVMKDAQGKVVSGTVDFNITGQYTEAVTVTGLHIHSGVAGVNGPVTVDSGINAANSVAAGPGRLLIQRTGQARADAAPAVATLEGLLSNPNAYYVNLHTSVNPGGMFRGQLYLAQRRTFMTSMSGMNEVPPVEGAFSGVGAFHGFRAFDAAGNYVSGGGLFVVNYNLAPTTSGSTTTPQRLTGLHIHRGAAGVNGPVVLDSTLTAATAIDTPNTGIGTVSFLMAAPNDVPAAVSALNDMWELPAGFYMNLHSVTFPGGIIRGQVRAAESVTMSLNMSPANEVPPIADLNAQAVSAVQVELLRNAAGVATNAMVVYSVNYRFPGETTFTGLHIHDGAAGVNGPVRLDSAITAANSVVSTTGFGNIFRVFNAANDLALAAVNGLLANPEGFYLNLHTSVNPGGAVRGQLAAPNTARPRVINYISGVSDTSLRVGAPGGLMTAFGENLFKVPSTLAGVEALPPSVNGTSATVGGIATRVLAMGETGGVPPHYLVLQTPVNAPAGPHDLVVSNSNGAGAAFRTSVAEVAPALYFDNQGGIALRQDLTLVRPNTPAAPGELIGLVSTGLGATLPALETGQFTPAMPIAVTQTITATIGGRPANVVATIALPGFAGIYVVTVMVPAGLPPGNAATQIRAGAAASNTVSIQVR